MCRQIDKSPSPAPPEKRQKQSTGPKKIGSVRLLRVAASRQVPTVNVQIFDSQGRYLSTITAVPDSGAEATVAGLDVLKMLDGDVENLLHRGADNLVAANGLSLETAGRMDYIVRFRGSSTPVTIIFSPEHSGMLLSWFVCVELGLLPTNYPEPVHVNFINGAVAPDSAAPSLQMIHVDDLPAIKEQLLKEFADVFDCNDNLRTMAGPPMSIELQSDAIPFAVNGARPIPFAQRDAVKKMLDDMVAQGVIQPVIQPTDWVHPLVVVSKPNGKIRICVDLTRLNRYVKRPLHPLITPKDAVAGISNKAKFFTSFDARHGYWQLPLDEESQLFTTFITPWGRFKFLRGPMGLVSTGDEYCRRTDSFLGDIPRLIRVVDDMLLFSDDLATHVADVRGLLMRCREHNITLGAAKFMFAVDKIPYAGYIVQPGGVSADPRKLDAIARFPRPTNITHLRSFMGLVNQLADFSTEIAATEAPLRPLLHANTPFIWTADHERAFEDVKKALISPPILAQFDMSAETVLQTDASLKNGMGYVLLQRQSDKWRLIQCGSRFVSDTESRYAVIELELSAVKWAMEKCHLFLKGLPKFTLVVDHQPLVTILDKQTLDAVENPKLPRLKERISGYVFKTVWRKGKDHAIPDALSRAPVNDPEPDDMADDPIMLSHIRAGIACKISTIIADDEYHPHLIDPMLEELRAAAIADPQYEELVLAVENGFTSDSEKLEPFVRQFWNIRNELWTDDGLVLYGSRLVIPVSKRAKILSKLHVAHQGIERSKRRARQVVYWPGISSDITKTAASGRLDTEAFQQGLLEWRNTPKFDGLSPAEIVFGHPIRSILPAHRATFARHSKFAGKWRDIMDQRDTAYDDQMQKVEDGYNAHARPLAPIPAGTAVRIQDPISKRWDRRGVVVLIGNRRDYRVKMQSGRVYWRNRRFLRIDYSSPPEEPDRPADDDIPAGSSDVLPQEAVNIPSPNPASSTGRRGRKRVQFQEQPLRRSSRLAESNKK